MKSVLITPEGIQKNLKNIKPLDAICEYIWNGFDAFATQVEVELHRNKMGLINMITIRDNGCGINYDELKYKFQPFNDSKKANVSQKTNHTLPHGRKGIGRLTFFAFSQTARWDTVYRKDGDTYEYYISMNKDSLNQYDDNGEKLPCKVEKLTGTKVSFTQLESMEKEDIINKIKEEFFWFLELNKENDYKIIVDKECIDYSDFVEHTENMDVSKYGCKETYDVRFVQWKQKLGNEYSRIYYLGSDNKERYKETTKLNKRADHFFHSVYIKSSYFDDFHFTNEEIEGQGDLFPNKCDDEYKILINGINTFLIKYRSRYLKEASDAYISKLIDDKLYPEFDTTNFIQAYQKKELDSLVGALYAAQPKIFTGLSNDNKKITLQLLRLIMDNGNKPELFKILQGVIELDMLRQDRQGKVTENVVVELKRPKIKLGEKELSQVKKYMRVIKDTPRFNAGNVKWTFYLVGNEFDKSHYISGELESHKHLGEQHLVHCQDDGLTKIYVLKWSEIFDDYSKRHDFLMEHLKLEEKLWLETHESADEAVTDVKNNSATLSEAVIPKNQKIVC